ncbi:MAG: hypothetical protein IT355_03905 [Gemmatimonadaceae bacterium]|nr:hypothetical protein [Gemmatimonadaceae bacterium]
MRRLLAAAVAVTACATVLPAQRSAVPTPASILGFEPGTDRRLPSWKQVTDYFTALDAASPHIQVRTLGKTTLGRPFIVAFISDSANLANLEHLRQVQQQLLDPRKRTDGDRERLLSEGRTIVLITSSIHSTEVGGFSSPLVIADRLLRGDTPESREILKETIIMLVPSQNPDGVDIVGDWYRSTVGTPAEGTQPPQLYHHYTGHDNNRDWYAFTQVEQRMVLDSLYSPWTPAVVNDIHQQGANGGRIFIPPYMDPVEPNIDPVLTSSTNALGMHMGWRMIAEGKTGIATNASYDQWSPARQYSLNHHGVRILTETASARLASPIEIPFTQLGTARGYDARVSSWNFPARWPGGTWTYGDIVAYQASASWAMLASVARDRRQWLESYLAVADRAMDPAHPWTTTDVPSAYVIPRDQADPQALQRLVWTLQHGQVEVYESAPAGSYIVPTRQPFGSYAKTLLERQHYPNLSEYPGGPPKRPYDVTAHTLPLLFGVRVDAVTGAAPALGALAAPMPEPRFTVPGLSTRSPKRIAIYRSYPGSMDEGWTRWLFDVNHIPYRSVLDAEMRAGNLKARHDVIIVPDQGASQLRRGLGAPYPDSLRGGLGDAGAASLKAFVEAGGTLITFNDASEYAIETLELPVKNVLAGVRNTDFYAPGSLMAITLNRASPVTARMTAPVPAAWFEDSPAFEITDPARAVAVASYPGTGDPLLSGWLLGGSRLNGRAAMVDVTVGKGHVILFGFRPQYRGQSMNTQPLLWGSILR